MSKSILYFFFQIRNRVQRLITILEKIASNQISFQISFRFSSKNDYLEELTCSQHFLLQRNSFNNHTGSNNF